jgi:hypothetical protein
LRSKFIIAQDVLRMRKTSLIIAQPVYHCAGLPLSLRSRFIIAQDVLRMRSWTMHERTLGTWDV